MKKKKCAFCGGYYGVDYMELWRIGLVCHLCIRRSWVKYPRHIDSARCWCEPTLEYDNPETGAQVWVHKEIY